MAPGPIGRAQFGRLRCLWREKGVEQFKREVNTPCRSRTCQQLAVACPGTTQQFATRLLDWTTNPLVALWDAVKDPPEAAESGLVWAFHYDESEAVFSTCKMGSPFAVDRTYVYFPEYVYPFIQAQSGVFTVHHKVEPSPDISLLWRNP